MDVLNATIRAVFASVDDVVLECIFVVRACVMKSVPAFLQGAYCSAMRVALRWADRDRDSRDIVGQTRAWKLFLFFQRLLLYRRGLVPKSRLRDLFATGHWVEFLVHNQECTDQLVVVVRCRRRRHRGDDPQRRSDRAEVLVQMCEPIPGRHVFELAPIAPGTEAILEVL